MANGTGNLFIVSAPSGAGKTSLVNALVGRLTHVELSISHTTRPRRGGEVHGRDYLFVDVPTFEGLIQADAFLEHARVHGNHYGTTRAEVDQRRAAGIDVILEIDWQGAAQIRQRVPDSRSIFVLPPSRTALEQRLRGRGQDSEVVIAQRLAAAEAELQQYGMFDYLVVNDVFEDALEDLASIVRAERLRQARQRLRHKALLEELVGAAPDARPSPPR